MRYRLLFTVLLGGCVYAGSVIVRHPTSKYAEEASVLCGVALARMGQGDEALGPLSRIGLTEEAFLAAGRGHVILGNLTAGDAAFSQLIQSKDPERRREAHYQHAASLATRPAPASVRRRQPARDEDVLVGRRPPPGTGGTRVTEPQ